MKETAEQAVYRALILGCGSSGGVPRVNGDWGACDPNNTRNRRSRCSLIIERAHSRADLTNGAVTRLLIDTSPDLRQQFLDNQIQMIDGLAYTHTHADQAHGIDDVRALVYARGERLQAIMSPETTERLHDRFGYIFKTPQGSNYPPLLITQVTTQSQTGTISGQGGDITVQLFDVEHGGEPCSGIRVGPIAYTPDVNGLDEKAFSALEGVSVWILDALRETPHPSHAHLDMSLNWLKNIKPTLGVLTNLHIDLDYTKLTQQCPVGVCPAHDGMSIMIGATDGYIYQNEK